MSILVLLLMTLYMAYVLFLEDGHCYTLIATHCHFEQEKKRFIKVIQNDNLLYEFVYQKSKRQVEK